MLFSAPFTATSPVVIRHNPLPEYTRKPASTIPFGSRNSELPPRLSSTLGCLFFHHSPRRKVWHVEATAEREVYQPFRPPPAMVPGSPVEKLSVQEQISVLRDRRGLWHEYANYVPFLIRNGLTPPMIDEATGLSGVEQNKIVVGSQVRSSLKSSGMDEASLAYFDLGGADILYELRILSAEQRKAAAELVIERKMDPKESQDLARAMKDYDRRQREEGWDNFSSHPGDCIAFACYRQSKEYKNESEIHSILEKGLKFAVSEKAQAKLLEAMQKDENAESSEKEHRLQVARLSFGELGATRESALLPVIAPSVQEFEKAPAIRIFCNGPFRIRHSEVAWKDWVVLPRWEHVASSQTPIAIAFPDASIFPWKVMKSNFHEPILLIVDRDTKDLEEECFYLVADQAGKLSLQLGTVVSETGNKALAKALLALRPPSAQADEFEIEDWD